MDRIILQRATRFLFVHSHVRTSATLSLNYAVRIRPFDKALIGKAKAKGSAWNGNGANLTLSIVILNKAKPTDHLRVCRYHAHKHSYGIRFAGHAAFL